MWVFGLLPRPGAPSLLRLRRLSGFLLKIGSDSLDIVFYFLLLGMSASAQAQQSHYYPI